MSILGRSIKVMRLHATTHLSGIGSIGTAINLTEVSAKFTGVTLTHVEGGVLFKSKLVEAFFPAANIVSTELYPEVSNVTPIKK